MSDALVSSKPHARPARLGLGASLLLALLGSASCAAGLAEHTTDAPPERAGAEVRTVDLVQTPGRISPTRLTLPAGRYAFRVRNADVPHPVGLHIARMTEDHGIGEEVAGSRVEPAVGPGQTGTTAVVELPPGRYSYRCTQNPTPHYFLTVE